MTLFFHGCRSFLPICPSKTSSQPTWSKPSTRGTHGERASTLPRTKPRTHSSPALSTKPSVSVCPPPKTNSSPTLKKPKPRDFLRLPASQFSDPPPAMHSPKPCVSPTLTVPTPRLSPSPPSHGTGLDGRGGKNPSPVAKERQARSIAISNAKVEPGSVKQSSSDEAKRDTLDQEAFVDFAHPASRRASPVSRHQTDSELCRQAAPSQNSCLSHIPKDKPKPAPGEINIPSIREPESNYKQQQEFLPRGATGTQTSPSEHEGGAHVVWGESQSLFDVPATRSSLNLPRKRIDFPQRRTLSSSEHPCELMSSQGSAASPTTPRTNPSPDVESRRRRFDLNEDDKADAGFLSILRRPNEESYTRTTLGNPSKLPQQTSVCRDALAPPTHRLWSKAPFPASQSDCVSKDYSCQSRDIDRETESLQCADRFNRFKTRLLAPRTQEAPRAASDEYAASKTALSRTDVTSHNNHPSDPKQHKSHREVSFCDTALIQTDLSAPSDHHGVKLLEYPPEGYCPFNTNSVGISSKGLCGLQSQPRHRVSQRPGETTTGASPLLHRPSYPPAGRALIMEDPEDPYYVTMYYPGSVYVGEYPTLGRLSLNSQQIPQRSHDRQGLSQRLWFNLCRVR